MPAAKDEAAKAEDEVKHPQRKLVPVKVLKHFDRYYEGETVGVEEDEVDDLIEQKLVEKTK